MVAGSNGIRNKLDTLQNIPQYSLKVKDMSLMVTLGAALEMTRRGMIFLPVDINKSEATTFVMEEKGLRML